ncbi:MAG: beta-galactosidase, partial [Elusimicrobiota bacterium]|nr:beta-galactosidase [Elusimicrobiota bacterium]
ERWYSKLLPIIYEYQISKKGTIIMVQLCNEIGMVHWLNRSADYSESTEKMYKDFLEKKYKSINRLNAAYKTNYKNFTEIKQPKNNEADKENFL